MGDNCSQYYSQIIFSYFFIIPWPVIDVAGMNCLLAKVSTLQHLCHVSQTLMHGYINSFEFMYAEKMQCCILSVLFVLWCLFPIVLPSHNKMFYSTFCKNFKCYPQPYIPSATHAPFVRSGAHCTKNLGAYYSNLVNNHVAVTKNYLIWSLFCKSWAVIHISPSKIVSLRL